MKNLTNPITRNESYSHIAFYKFRKPPFLMILFLVGVLLNFTISCTYLRTKKVSDQTKKASTLNKLLEGDKYFIIRNENKLDSENPSLGLLASNMIIENDKIVLNLSKQSDRLLWLRVEVDVNIGKYHKYEKEILKEVRIIVKDGITLSEDTNEIDFNDIIRLEIVKQDIARTSRDIVGFGFLGLILIYSVSYASSF